jgi:hypothetical protein
MRKSLLVLLLTLLPMPLAAQPGSAAGRGSCRKPCRASQRDQRAVARQTAESDTGGLAVAMRPVRINGSTVWGFEVIIHMPGRTRGWRCLVDLDFPPKVYNKYPIPNPPAPKPGRQV